MILNQKYILNVNRHLDWLASGERILLGVSLSEELLPKLIKMGFTKELRAGDTILPSPKTGRFCRYNAEGKTTIHRNQEKETAYRTVEWHWLEWHGKEQVEQSDFRDVPYQRYPRSLIPPTSIELKFDVNEKSQSFLVSPIFEYRPENFDPIQISINMFLEIFGFCEIFTGDLMAINKTPVRRVNWEILPPGQYPWEKIHQLLKPIIDEAKPGNRPVITNRLETISSYTPDWYIIGHGGFRGYIIHGFPEKGLFVLESMFYGNATYVFGRLWEDLSKLTKAEIINEDFQLDRIIHVKGWHTKINKLLK